MAPNLPPRKVSASPVLFFFFVLLALQDPEKRFSIIECVNHMFFQKIRNTHLEDTKWQLQSVDVSCQLKWCQPGCLANGFSCSGSCWNSPSIATWMEWGRACKLFIFVGCLIMHRSRIHHALTSKGFWQH